MAFNLAEFGNKKIKELEEQFKKHLVSKKEQQGKNMQKKKLRKKIPSRKIDSPETMTKRDFENLEKGIERLKEFERELDSLDTSRFSVEAASIRAKLKDVSQLPMIDKEMRLLKLKLKEKERKIERKETNIDYDVDVLVDTDFNDFLSGLKTAVSQKVRKREQEIEERLNHDLLNREKKYRQKHLELLQEFEAKRNKLAKQYDERYRMDVKINLQKEVEEKFDKLLKQHLEREKAILSRKYREEIREEERKKLENERKELHKVKNELEEKYKKKLQQYEEEMKKKLAQILGN